MKPSKCAQQAHRALHNLVLGLHPAKQVERHVLFQGEPHDNACQVERVHGDVHAAPDKSLVRALVTVAASSQWGNVIMTEAALATCEYSSTHCFQIAF